MNLTTAADLAEQWGIDVEQLHRLRKRYGWPHVRLGRYDIRFSDEQIAQIVAMQTRRTVTPAEPKGAGKGQTKRSAARSRS